MKGCDGLFRVKLYELERHYEHLMARLRISQGQDAAKIRQEIDVLTDLCAETELMLKKSVDASHSPHVARLAELQHTYMANAEKGLQDALNAEDDSREQSELAALYAEYAIDFAVEAMNHALLSSLRAIELQLKTKEEDEA